MTRELNECLLGMGSDRQQPDPMELAMTVITRPVLETEVAKTLIVNHVSPALQVDWPGLGNGSFTVPLTAGGSSVLDVAGYRKLSIRVGSTKSPTVDLIMGMIDPTTLAS